MDIKKLNEEIEKLLESENPVLDRIRQEYPQNIEEDLTEQYKDLVIESLEDLLSPKDLDRYLSNLKITKTVTHWENSSYIQYQIFGEYSQDSIISGRISVQANKDGKNHTNEVIFSGFTRNPIGKIENRYTFDANFIFTRERVIFMELVRQMEAARKQSMKSSQAYIDYVQRTGDLS